MPARRRRRSAGARRPRRRRSRCRGGGSARARRCCASRGMTQPVGLFGELTISARVPGVSVAIRRSTSSVQPSGPKSSDTVSTPAPRIFGISTTFGHSGVTATARSPGPTISCAASISALTPALVTATFAAGVGPCSRVAYAAMRVAQRRDAEVVRVERRAAFERGARGVADEGRRDAVRLAEPERQHVGDADALVRHRADARAAQVADRVAREGADGRRDGGKGVHGDGRAVGPGTLPSFDAAVASRRPARRRRLTRRRNNSQDALVRRRTDRLQCPGRHRAGPVAARRHRRIARTPPRA